MKENTDRKKKNREGYFLNVLSLENQGNRNYSRKSFVVVCVVAVCVSAADCFHYRGYLAHNNHFSKKQVMMFINSHVWNHSYILLTDHLQVSFAELFSPVCRSFF